MTNAEHHTMISCDDNNIRMSEMCPTTKSNQNWCKKLSKMEDRCVKNWWILILAIGIIGASSTIFLFLLAAAAACFVGYKVIYGKEGPSSRMPMVSVIDLHGTIMSDGGMASFSSSDINLISMKKKIDTAFAPPSLEAVILSINSPGGSPVQSDLVSAYIKRKAEAAEVPVIVFVEDMAASGGYWLACTGSEIYAARSSILGSIGVITMGLGLPELIKKLGVENRTYTSGESKSINNPLDPVKESDVAIIKRNLNEIHQVFIEHVKNSRGEKLAEDEAIFSGQYWTADGALKLGLIDGIDHCDAYIEKRWGKEGRDVRVYRLRSKLGGLAGLLGGVTSFLDDPLGSLSLLASSAASTPAPLTEDTEVISLASCLK